MLFAIRVKLIPEPDYGSVVLVLETKLMYPNMAKQKDKQLKIKTKHNTWKKKQNKTKQNTHKKKEKKKEKRKKKESEILDWVYHW